MSADGDHQRTIEAVLAALQAKARDLDTEFSDWSELFAAASTVVDLSNSDRVRWLYGGDRSDPVELNEADRRARYAARTLEMERCSEFSTWDKRCELAWEDHHEDDLGRHHQDEARAIFNYSTRQMKVWQERWVTPVRSIEPWEFY